MLAKLTAKNQLTLPKAVTSTIGPVEYFDVQARDGVILLTPVRIQHADAVRDKLAELKLGADDIDAAVEWSRGRVNEPATSYRATSQGRGAPRAGKKRNA